MRPWQIVGLVAGLLLASVVVIVGLTLFVLPADTFDSQRDALDGVEVEDEAEDGAEEADTEPAA